MLYPAGHLKIDIICYLAKFLVIILQKDALVANVGAMGAIVANSAKLPGIPSPQGYVGDPS